MEVDTGQLLATLTLIEQAAREARESCVNGLLARQMASTPTLARIVPTNGGGRINDPTNQARQDAERLHGVFALMVRRVIENAGALQRMTGGGDGEEGDMS